MGNNSKIAIVTDSSCDLPNEIIEQYHLHVLPLRIISSKGEFRDRIDISPEDLYAIMKEEIPKTSLPLPEEIGHMYSSLYEEGYTDILHFSISSRLSGTYNISRLVADEFKEDHSINIHVIDTLTLSAGLGLIVLEAAKSLEKGYTCEEIIARCYQARSTQLGVFIVKTLEYLRKGGRIGLVEGVVGNLLKIRPVIYVNKDGVYETLAKARGYANALETMVGEVVRKYANKKIHLTVVHGAALEEANQLLEKLKNKLNVISSYISPVSPALAIHTGPGLLGIIAHEVI